MNADLHDQPVIDFPIAGECWVLNPPGHSRWAFDLLPVQAGSAAIAEGGWWRYLTCRLRSQDLFGWQRPVRSPVDGAVLACHDAEQDRDRLVPWRDVPAGFIFRPLLRRGDVAAMAGNHVVLGADGTYVFLAHLQRASVRVRADQRIAAGDAIGLVGASGNVIAPHLHMQVMDGPDPLTADIRPFLVRKFRVRTQQGWEERHNSPLPSHRVRIRVD